MADESKPEDVMLKIARKLVADVKAEDEARRQYVERAVHLVSEKSDPSQPSPKTFGAVPLPITGGQDVKEHGGAPVTPAAPVIQTNAPKR